MAIQSQPTRIPEPFAGSGTKNTIPATNATPSASQAASWASGFPPECSQPISAGGCPVPRNDVNGALNQLSQDFAFRQDGGIWGWSALADYDAQRMVRGSDGLLYWSVAQSGPGFGAGAQDPTLDTAHAYWVSPQVPEMPADDSSNSVASTAWVNAWHANNLLPNNVYVDSINGDDSNSGFSASEAKKNIYAMESTIASPFFMKPSSITIHVAPGTYGHINGFCVNGVDGIKEVFDFDSGAVLNGGVNLNVGLSVVFIGDVKITPTSPSGNYVANQIVNIESGSIFGLGLDNEHLNLEINNASKSTCFSIRGGQIIANFWSSSISIKYTGTCSFITNLNVQNFGYFEARYYGGRISWSGTVSGKRYGVNNFSIVTNIGGQNVIPGSTDGTVSSNSVFN